MTIWEFFTTSPESTAAFISGSFMFISAIIPSICVLHTSNAKKERNKFIKRYQLALKEIEFLQAVEKEHTAIHLEHRGRSLKRTVRAKVNAEGLYTTNEFKPSLLVKKIESTEKKLEEAATPPSPMFGGNRA